MLEPEKMLGILLIKDQQFTLYPKDSKASKKSQRLNWTTLSETLTFGAHNLLKVKCQMAPYTLVNQGYCVVTTSSTDRGRLVR